MKNLFRGLVVICITLMSILATACQCGVPGWQGEGTPPDPALPVAKKISQFQLDYPPDRNLLVSGDTVIVVTNSSMSSTPSDKRRNILYGFSAIDGKLKWKKDFAKPHHLMRRSHLIQGKILLHFSVNTVTGTENHMVCLSAGTGQELWKINAQEQRPFFHEGEVRLFKQDTLSTLDLSSGKVKSQKNLPRPQRDKGSEVEQRLIWWSPSHRVYTIFDRPVKGNAHTVSLMDNKTNKVIFEEKAESNKYTLHSKAGIFYLVQQDKIIAFDLKQNKRIWSKADWAATYSKGYVGSKELGLDHLGDIQVGTDRIFFGGKKRNIVAFSNKTGKTSWESDVFALPELEQDSWRLYSPSLPLLFSKQVISSGEGIVLFSIDRDTGEMLWKYSSTELRGKQGRQVPSPVIVKGKVFFVGADKIIRVIEVPKDL